MIIQGKRETFEKDSLMFIKKRNLENLSDWGLYACIFII